jgi:hypothetical protein
MGRKNARHPRSIPFLFPALVLGLTLLDPGNRAGFAAAPAAPPAPAPSTPAPPPRALAGPALAGYFIDSTEAFAPRPEQAKETTGDFTFTIHRGFPDSTSERLLGIAEAAYPPRDLLIRIAAEKNYEVGSDSAHVPLWWCQGVAERRVPYAITARSLDHYLELTRLFRDRKFSEAGTQPLFWSDLSYRATIAQRDTFLLGSRTYKNVYVAQLHLVWIYDDGTFMPSSRASRVVVLSPDGKLLAVDGDGSAEESVGMSTHRGVGREEKVLR